MKRIILLFFVIAVFIISCSDSDISSGSSSSSSSASSIEITSISQVGTIENGNIDLVAVNNNYVYFCGYNSSVDTNSFSIYDFSNPSNPVKILITNIGYAEGISTDGNFVYIETDGGGSPPFDIKGIHVFDCRDTNNIIYVTNNSDGYNNAFQNYCHNGYLYSCSFNILGIFQTSLGGELTHLYNITTDDVRFADFSGNYMYLVDDKTFRIFDISTPSSPTLMGTNYNSSFGGTDCAVKGDYVFAGGVSNNFVVIDISDKSSPVEITNYSMTNGATDYLCEMKILENYLLIAGDYDFYVVDISNPSTPVQVDMIGMGYCAGRGFAISGRYAVVADDTLCRIIQLY